MQVEQIGPGLDDKFYGQCDNCKTIYSASRYELNIFEGRQQETCQICECIFEFFERNSIKGKVLHTKILRGLI